MPCNHVNLPDGGYAIVCSRGGRSKVCSVCKRQTRDAKLCDFPVGPGKTCDRVLCPACATHKDPDIDYCPEHTARTPPEGRLKL